jgi:hypothetical protein
MSSIEVSFNYQQSTIQNKKNIIRNTRFDSLEVEYLDSVYYLIKKIYTLLIMTVCGSAYLNIAPMTTPQYSRKHFLPVIKGAL